MAKAENINSDILAWARKSAGLSLDDAATRLGIASTETISAADKLEELETGAKFPTRSQLAKFAAVYRRPLITFYMKQPPQKGERGEDFRTLTGNVSNRENAMLDALLRDIHARQEMVRSLREDEEDVEPLAFVGSRNIRDGVPSVVESISKALGVSEGRKDGRNGSPDDFFRELRNRAERIGVFVLLVGDLGSHHSAISETVFRGFTIADRIAPFVVINDQDAKSARAFTLLHELAHIWLGQTGVSGTPYVGEPRAAISKIEQFCNDVAGAFLLPDSAFPSEKSNDFKADRNAVMHEIERIAASWSVSEPMVAYRLNRLGWITPTVYRELQATYAARWHAIKLKDKSKANETEGGPSYYVVKQFKLGNALVDLVRRTVRNNELSHTKAAKVLGVNPGSVEPLLRRFESRRGAVVPDFGSKI
ncbi:helix-turn-helix domain-containing protein [Methylocella silvestris]|uniref:DNA-binding protein n=1 Tax=Methylocella silvestris TaxID=199596 RepID=A0A2J7TIA4_METSI|nr:XRE family transcriptional regulator [Methylocella silvestris]PNG26477.1 DNA-binding protein [Methylocella silvestris]